MFKYLWLMLLMSAASILYAAVEQKNDGVNCYKDHNEPYGCSFDASGTCFWNYGRNFCDTRFNFIECRLAPNYDTCIITVGCEWDNVNHWCDDMNQEAHH